MLAFAKNCLTSLKRVRLVGRASAPSGENFLIDKSGAKRKKPKTKR